MGNTVLTYLRKMKHPDMITRVNDCTSHKWYSHQTISGGETSMLVRKNNRKVIITMYFKRNHEIYDFTIERDAFYAFRRLSENSKKPWQNVLNQKIVAEFLELPYNDFEAVIFQQSLVWDLGMIGTKEIEVLLELRNIYFKDTK